MGNTHIQTVHRASLSHCSTQHVTRTQLTLLELPLDWIYLEASNPSENILHEGKIKVKRIWCQRQQSVPCCLIMKGTSTLGDTGGRRWCGNKLASNKNLASFWTGADALTVGSQSFQAPAARVALLGLAPPRAANPKATDRTVHCQCLLLPLLCVSWRCPQGWDVWCGQWMQNGLDCFQRLLSEKDFALCLGQYGKLHPVSSGKGQAYFKAKKGHLWQVYPIQRDILSPKEREKKNPYLFYFCIFHLELPWCIHDMELRNVFKQNPASLP